MAGRSKKVRTRTGAGPPRHPETAAGLGRRPTRSRPREAGLHRRDRPVHEDGTAARKGATRRALPGRPAARPLEDHHLHRRAQADRDDRRHERQRVPGLCQPSAGSHPRAGRHRHHGQSACSQVGGRPQRDRGDRRELALPAALQSRLQPSRTPSPNSRRCCAPRPSEQSPPSGTPSALSSISSRRPNAQTTSRPQDMNQFKPDVL